MVSEDAGCDKGTKVQGWEILRSTKTPLEAADLLSQALDLIASCSCLISPQLLVYKPEKRLNPLQCLAHSFFDVLRSPDTWSLLLPLLPLNDASCPAYQESEVFPRSSTSLLKKSFGRGELGRPALSFPYPLIRELNLLHRIVPAHARGELNFQGTPVGKPSLLSLFPTVTLGQVTSPNPTPLPSRGPSPG